MTRAILISISMVVCLSACGSSIAGTATGTCRVRYGSSGEAPPVAGGERTDHVTLQIADAGHDAVRIQVAGCELAATKTPGADGPQYTITSGTCTMDVPGLGQRTFHVENRVATHAHTDEPGDDLAYMNIQGHELALVFEAPLEGGEVRVDCDATR